MSTYQRNSEEAAYWEWDSNKINNLAEKELAAHHVMNPYQAGTA